MAGFVQSEETDRINEELTTTPTMKALKAFRTGIEATQSPGRRATSAFLNSAGTAIRKKLLYGRKPTSGSR